MPTYKHKGIVLALLLLLSCQLVKAQPSTENRNRLRFVFPEAFVERTVNEPFDLGWERQGNSPDTFAIHVQCSDAPPTVLLTVRNSSQTEGRIAVPYAGTCRLLASGDDDRRRALEGISEDFGVTGTSQEPATGRGRILFQRPIASSPVVAKVEFNTAWEHLGIVRAPDTFDIRVKCASGEGKDDYVGSTFDGLVGSGFTVPRTGKGCRLYAYSQDQGKGLEGRSDEFDVFASAEDASSSASGGMTVTPPTGTFGLTSSNTETGPTPTQESSSTAASITEGPPSTTASGTSPPNVGTKLASNGYIAWVLILAVFGLV